MRGKKSWLRLYAGILLIFLLTGLIAIIWPPEMKMGDNSERLLPPGTTGHLLGTDALGRDVLAMLFQGTGLSLQVALPSCLMIWLLGISFGLLAGLPGYARLHLPRQVPAAALAAAGPAAYYLLYMPFQIPSTLIAFILIVLLFLLIWHFLPRPQAKVTIHIALWARSVIEFLSVFPRLLFVFVFTSMFSNHTLSLIFLLGLSGWAGLARVVWTETRKVYAQPYMDAAIAMGFTESYRLLKYAFPAIFPLTLVVLSYSFSSIIMAEASLSFLEVGLPPQAATWGRMILSAKANPEAWWLLLFPVLLIFAITFCLHRFTWLITAKYYRNGFELVS